MTCNLYISGSPIGAKVYIDGDFIGSSPIEKYKINPGTYKISIGKSGYISKDYLNYKINSNDLTKDLSFSLKEKEEEEEENTGEISVNSSPADARVYLAGDYIGATPKVRNYPIGKYELKINKVGFIEQTDSVKIEKNKTTGRFYTLKELPGVWERIYDAVVNRLKLFPKLSRPALSSLWQVITGKEFTDDEALKFELTVNEWISPANALSKLFFGKNIQGEDEEFNAAWDTLDIAASFLFFVPIAKAPLIGEKIAGKAGIGGLSTLAGRMGEKKIAPEVIEGLISKGAMDAVLNEARKFPAKFAEALPKVSEPFKSMLLKGLRRAENPTAYKLALDALMKDAGNVDKGILSGISAFIKSKPLVWAVSGTIGMDGIMTWLASDNIVTGTGFYISKLEEAIKSGTISKEEAKAELDEIQKWKDYATNFIQASTILNPLLWIFRDLLLTNAELAQGRLDLDKGIIEKMTGIGFELPEVLSTNVRNIIDGDTIDVSLDYVEEGKILLNGEKKLPEYGTTGHARIRLLGIDAPETSTKKGDVIMGDLGTVNVGAEWADNATAELKQYNEKYVTLYIDPTDYADTHGRIIAKVVYNGKDICLEQIKKGLATFYTPATKTTKNKYLNETIYSNAQETAKSNELGFWKNLATANMKISITSEPSNAKLFLDGQALHHNTPADNLELADVLYMFTTGSHTIRAEKSGMAAEKTVNITSGDNGEIKLTLSTVGLPGTPTPTPTPGKQKTLFTITSEPTKAKVWIDEVYTHHETPTDEIEQKDVIHLWTPGSHKIRLDKSGYSAEQTVMLSEGQRMTWNAKLTGLPPTPSPTPTPTPTPTPSSCQDYINQITQLQSELATCRGTPSPTPSPTPTPTPTPSPTPTPTPTPSPKKKILQSWTAGSLGTDDEQDARATALKIDTNGDGSYTSYGFYQRISTSGLKGDEIGKTDEGWSVRNYSKKIYVYTGALAHGSSVAYYYKPSL